MPETKLSFNKRVKLVQNECFDSLTKEDLSKTANSKSGYYSLETIFKYLNPLLDKYELNLDILEISTIRIHLMWYDDLSDQIREHDLSYEKLRNIGRLPSMTNEVQSFGAVLTYIKRYAYCMALRLNSTDIIENEYPKQPEKQQNNQNKHIRYYYAIFNKKFNKNTLESKIDPLILKIYNVKSKNNIPAEKLNELTKWADKKTPEQILDGLEKKRKLVKK